MKKIIATFILALTALLCASAYAGLVVVKVYNNADWIAYLAGSQVYVDIYTTSGRVLEGPPLKVGENCSTYVYTKKDDVVGLVEVNCIDMYYNMCENKNEPGIENGTLTIKITSVHNKPLVPVCSVTLESGGTTTHPVFPCQ